jgi:deazaflavin-dependent oxidoreductase (nitroreductase family)
LIGAALRLGIGLATMRVLTVRGRRSGRRYETPVNLVHLGDRWYLVSPYGVGSWVKNARVAGSVELRRGRDRQRRVLEEVEASAAAPVLREYLRRNRITRPYFDVGLASDDAAIAAEAPRHPVFRLLPEASS